MSDKQKNILKIAVISAIVAIVVFLAAQNYKKGKELSPEEKIRKGLGELNALETKLSEEEIRNQLQSLNKIPVQNGQALSEQNAREQLQKLNQLRSQ